MAGNAPQTTVPLPLGMGLDADPRLVAESLAIPITGQNAELLEAASAADVGTSFPVVLGLQLATSGVSAYGITAESLAIPITVQSADLIISDPGADAGMSAPLALGMLLGTTAYTLVGESLYIPITFAPGEAFEEDAEAVVEVRPSRRAGARSKLETARRRIALNWLYDYLTKPKPSEDTKRVIRAIKAGRPIPEGLTPPKGPESISASKLAAEMLPERRQEAEIVLPSFIDLQKVVENAIQIAKEREEEEDILMLL